MERQLSARLEAFKAAVLVFAYIDRAEASKADVHSAPDIALGPPERLAARRSRAPHGGAPAPSLGANTALAVAYREALARRAAKPKPAGGER
jgi:hypothetical protein